MSAQVCFIYLQGYLFLSPNYRYGHMAETKEFNLRLRYEYRNFIAPFIPDLIENITKFFEAMLLFFFKTESSGQNVDAIK